MKLFKKIFLVLVIFSPLISLAAIVPDCVTGSGNGVDCGFSDLVKMFNSFIDWFLGISSVLATITCVMAGAKILLNPSNPGERTKAIGMFTKALIGIAIVLLAWIVMKTAIGVLVNPNTGALRFFSN